MTKASPDVLDEHRQLRDRAQRVVAREGVPQPFGRDAATVAYELGVHQIELTMQNEELRRSQEALARSLADYRDLYENAPVGYLTLDARGGCLCANRAAAALLGVANDQLVGRPLQSLLSRGEADRLTRHLAASRSHGACQSEQLVVNRENRDVHVRFDTIAVAEERGVVFRTSLTDVSEKTRLLEEIRELNQTLERRVRERTVALSRSNQRLERELRARARVEQALVRARQLEAVGRLAGGVAHDFNNLLATIRLGLHFVVQRIPRSPEVGRCVRDIDAAVERAGSLTSKLLAFARCEVVRPVAVDVVHLIERLRSTLRRLVRSEIDLDVSLDGAAWILIDPVSLERVLLNLVLNARDAVDGAGRIAISVQPIEVDERQLDERQLDDASRGAYVRLRVSDDGCGMTQAQLDRIFEPFYTTKDARHGTGLGLATVHGIVAAAGGFIAVDSSPGRGTTIDVAFPQVMEPGAPELVLEEVPSRGGSETVLVVDDQPPVRTALARALRSVGYAVREASSGPEALAELAAHPGDVDVVVTDVVMSGMSGVALAREMSARHPLVPVVLMSGYTSTEVVTASYPYLKKPFSPEQACAVVRAALDGRDIRSRVRS